MTIGEPS